MGAKKLRALPVLVVPQTGSPELNFGMIAAAMRQIVWSSGKDDETVEEMGNLAGALLDAIGRRVSHMARFLALATRQTIGLNLLQEALRHAKLDTTLVLD